MTFKFDLEISPEMRASESLPGYAELSKSTYNNFKRMALKSIETTGNARLLVDDEHFQDKFEKIGSTTLIEICGLLLNEEKNSERYNQQVQKANNELDKNFNFILDALNEFCVKSMRALAEDKDGLTDDMKINFLVGFEMMGHIFRSNFFWSEHDAFYHKAAASIIEIQNSLSQPVPSKNRKIIELYRANSLKKANMLALTIFKMHLFMSKKVSILEKLITQNVIDTVAAKKNQLSQPVFVLSYIPNMESMTQELNDNHVYELNGTWAFFTSNQDLFHLAATIFKITHVQCYINMLTIDQIFHINEEDINPLILLQTTINNRNNLANVKATMITIIMILKAIFIFTISLSDSFIVFKKEDDTFAINLNKLTSIEKYFLLNFFIQEIAGYFVQKESLIRADNINIIMDIYKKTHPLLNDSHKKILDQMTEAMIFSYQDGNEIKKLSLKEILAVQSSPQKKSKKKKLPTC